MSVSRNAIKTVNIIKKQMPITELDRESGFYFFDCPHCNLVIQVHVSEINCTIFRHGYFYNKDGDKINLTEQIGPHTSKEECERLVRENRIIGCGKPFKMIKTENGYNVEVCDYI
jgi:hypothetical protein